jgi:hypothetical protein
MILTLVWKEYRDQSAIWTAMAVLGSVLFAGVTRLFIPQGLEAIQETTAVWLLILLVILTGIYGLVSGAMLLAGEEEGRTQTFLDSLPVLRRQVWGSKLAAGLTLSLVQALLLAGVVAATGLPLLKAPPIHWLWLLPAIAFEACAWGLLSSSLFRSVMPAVLVAFPMWAGASLLWPTRWDLVVPILIFRAGLALAAMTLSFAVYCRSDWQRLAAQVPAQRGRQPIPPAPTSRLLVLLWLQLRQGISTIILLSVISFLLGLVLPRFGVLFWPMATLVVGVGCGTAVFLNDQPGSAYRFLGDQRLPLRWVWGVKTGFWLVTALGISVLTLVGVLLSGSTGGMLYPSRSLAPDDLRPWWSILDFAVCGGLGLLYGFGIGQFCSLIWRKSAVALVLALLLSVTVPSVWVPSLFVGGLHPWQVFTAPVLLVLAGGLVQRAWVNDRLYTARPLAVLLGGVALAGLSLVGGIGYRVAEVPDVGEPFNVAAFRDSLPTPEQNEAGRRITAALEKMQEQKTAATWEVEPQHAVQGKAPNMGMVAAPGGGGAAPMMAGMMQPDNPPGPPQPAASTSTLEEQLADALQNGWPLDHAQLGQWLDLVFQSRPDNDWAREMRDATRLPLGVLFNPKTATAQRPNLDRCRLAGSLFAVRAVQLQAQGDHEAALDHLFVLLALSRQLRHDAVVLSWVTGIGLEKLALDGIGQWLERVGPQPELLRRALTELRDHEATLPPLTEVVEAEYLVSRNSIADPGAVLRLYGTPTKGPMSLDRGQVLALALQLPWEQVRAERLLNTAYAGWLRGVENEAALRAAMLQETQTQKRPHNIGDIILQGWLPAPDTPVSRSRLGELLTRSCFHDLLNLQVLWRTALNSPCRIRGTELQLALALYELEEGKPAANLEALVPRYLLGRPIDPFDGRSFRYRVSAGEEILWQGEQQKRQVAPGQGVIWSVGPDQIDSGGTHQGGGTVYWEGRPGNEKTDWIFLVPQWGMKP